MRYVPISTHFERYIYNYDLFYRKKNSLYDADYVPFFFLVILFEQAVTTMDVRVIEKKI